MAADADPRARALALWGSAVLGAAAFLDLPLRAWAAAQDPAMAGFWRVFTDIGDSAWMLWGTAAVAAFALAARARASSPRLRAGLREAAALGGFAFAAVGALGLLAAVLKLALGRPRPKTFPEIGAFDVTPLAFDYRLNSFPSGHATTVFALAAVAALILPRWRPAILALAGWGAFSRVAVGAHWASDALAGSALGYYGARALARLAAARGLAFGPDLAPRRPREAAAALRLAARRAARALPRAGADVREKLHASSRAALRRRRAHEERGGGD